MKIASVRRRFLSEFVVKFIITAFQFSMWNGTFIEAADFSIIIKSILQPSY